MSAPLRLGIAGLGTVGAGTVSLLRDNALLLGQRTGRETEIVAVSARDKSKDRGIDLAGLTWCDDPLALAHDPTVDVVVELIGGEDGAALALSEAALANGKHLVTANKALLAHHGTRLAQAAEAAGLHLGYEAAVAGGIPIIKALREGLAANRMSGVYGILNGTCNYIMTAMHEAVQAGQSRDFSVVLEEAQRLGYAEADPSTDVDGIDAAHKLAILTSVVFGCEVNFGAVHIEGIRHVSGLDIEFAIELGYRVKLLGIARETDAGIAQRVHPCMVRETAPIARIDGVFNAVVAEGDRIGSAVFEGPGAGGGPTASAIVADLVDIARGRIMPAFAVPAAKLRSQPTLPMDQHVGAYYIRLMVVDQPGVIADVAACLRDEEVSLEALLQRGRNPGELVPVVLTTHEANEASVVHALAAIDRLETILEPPRMIRIETF
jgi:homoserine dehydrogenase